MNLRIGQQTDVEEFIRPAFFLLVLTIIGLGASTPQLGLVGDDWWFFTHLSDGNLISAQLEANPARPGVAYIWWGLWKLFGLRIRAYYVFSFFVQWLTATTLLVVFKRLFCWKMLPAFAAASFFLLYPADTSRVYLSTISTRICVLLAVVASAAWIYSARIASQWRVGLRTFSLLLMILSLLTYETPVLLFAVVPLLPAGHRNRQSIWGALSCYAALASYLLFRLWVNHTISLRSPAPYVSVQLSPNWLRSQLNALPTAVISQGWLYSLKAMFDLGLWHSSILFVLFLAMGLLILALLPSGTGGTDRSWRADLNLIGGGLALSAIAVAPVIVSNLSLKTVVGTLNARFVHAAALGQALFLTGLCSLPWSILRPDGQTIRVCQRTSIAAFLSLALLGGLGMQKEYSAAWTAQLELLQQLQAKAPALRDNTAIVLLDIPARTFHLRFYYPLTQLVRRFYANSTIHVLPWQQGFPAEKQLVAFGQKSAVAAIDIVHRKGEIFDYEHMLAFQVQCEGKLKVADQIGPPYLYHGSPQQLPFQVPSNWTAASEPVMLDDERKSIAGEEPPDTAWRDWLLAQLGSAAPACTSE